jgi:acylpyruvate hydrolase
MRFAKVDVAGRVGLALLENDRLVARFEGDAAYPGPLEALVSGGLERLAAAASALQGGTEVAIGSARFLPPFATGKILCVGLNYVEHSKESGFEVPAYPTIFARFASSLIGHRAPMVRPKLSAQLDFEGELVAVIGMGGRRIARERALDHVIGYSVFNDGSIRDYQKKTPQWTVGKNFDGTGAFGPCFVTADELPPGARGLRLETRLNGETVQSASTDEMVFDVASLVSILSEAMTLASGDVLVTGTPSGVGVGRTPPLFMKAGDVCTVEIERIGTLENRIVDEVWR